MTSPEEFSLALCAHFAPLAADGDGAALLEWLATRRIGIAGAGGLGSNCALHLVRSGFANLLLADFDRVAPSNLNRQFFTAAQVGQLKVFALAANLRALNPRLNLGLHTEKLEPAHMAAVFADCHAVVEAFDDPRAKKALAEAVLADGGNGPGLLVSASGIGGLGRAGEIRVRRLRENWIMVGDLETPCEGSTPPLSPGVGAAAALQADALLDHFVRLYNRLYNRGSLIHTDSKETTHEHERT